MQLVAITYTFGSAEADKAAGMDFLFFFGAFLALWLVSCHVCRLIRRRRR